MQRVPGPIPRAALGGEERCHAPERGLALPRAVRCPQRVVEGGKDVQTLPYNHSDATGLPVVLDDQDQTHLGQMFFFGWGKLAAFRYSKDKEGASFTRMLGTFAGTLVLDASSTHNDALAAAPSQLGAHLGREALAAGRITGEADADRALLEAVGHRQRRRAHPRRRGHRRRREQQQQVEQLSTLHLREVGGGERAAGRAEVEPRGVLQAGSAPGARAASGSPSSWSNTSALTSTTLHDFRSVPMTKRAGDHAGRSSLFAAEITGNAVRARTNAASEVSRAFG